MKLSSALLIACLFALPALGAGPLDALRADSRGLREQVSALRAKQLEGRTELSTLSSRIQTLKEASKGKLLPGSELDSALKRSQELSGVLSELSQQVSSREAALETSNLALIDALSAELTRQRTEFDRQTNRDVRKQLIDSMRKLRAEREAIRQTLPATKLPALDTVKPSDDPEELLEQADLLRDNEEKLRRELKSLEARIAERRDEQELDKRVQRFMGEESMFDDSDRRLRVQRTVTTPATAPLKDNTTGLQNAQENNSAQQMPAPAGTTFDTTAGTGGNASPAAGGLFTPSALNDSRSGANAPPSDGTTFRTGLDSSNIRVTNASDARPQVGNGGSRPIAGGDDDLKDLEVERARIQSLAQQLKKKADELAKRAAELK